MSTPKEIRDAAYERAAQVAESHEYGRRSVHPLIADVAKAIRDLKSEPAPPVSAPETAKAEERLSILLRHLATGPKYFPGHNCAECNVIRRASPARPENVHIASESAFHGDSPHDPRRCCRTPLGEGSEGGG